MATSKAQRVGIIIIAIVMTVGTVGSFFIMIVANQNAQIDAREDEQKQNREQKMIQEKLADYQDEMAKYQQEVDKESAALGPQYYDTVKSYEGEAAPFDGSKVKELGKRDIKEGDGTEVADPNDMRAYYIGWNEKGKIFDSSLEGDTLKPPFSPASAIPGWQQGVTGMKIGGVRELTIPSSLAYGKDAQSDDIPANAPLKFIIIAIPKSDLKQPEIPQELMQGMQ